MIADRLREVQLQTRAASAGILSSGVLKNSAQTHQKRMQGECHLEAVTVNCVNCIFVSSLEDTRFT